MLKIIYNNPYRFLGVCSNSPVRDRVANANRLKAFLRVGKNLSFPIDLPNLIPPIIRTEDGLAEANNRINLPKEQLKHALFWFFNASPIDKMAIDYLQNGITQKASELFLKRENFSSLINRGVLAFILGENGEAIQSISKVIHDENYRDELVQSVCGSTFKIDENELARLFIDALIKEMNIQQLKALFIQYGVSTDDEDYISEKSIGEPIDAINSAIAQAKSIKNDDAAGQYQAGISLMNSTKEDLQTIGHILGQTDEQYKMVADNLAKQILQCGINYYNRTDETDEVSIDKAFILQNYALSIAVGKVTKDRCKENVDILKKKKDELPPKEARYYDKKIKDALAVYMTQPNKISYAIDLIKKVVPYLMSIKEVLGNSNTYYLRISTLIVNAALHNVIEEFNNIMNDQIQTQLLFDRYGTLRRITNVFEQAWTATLYMDKLDMEPDFKRGRYNQNRSSLKNQVEQLIDVYQHVTLDMRGETKFFNDCRTVSDFNKYISLFPGGKYATLVAGKLEEAEFNACKTPQDCQKFKNKYPLSKYNIQAKQEDCHFNQCKKISDFKEYIKYYPKGRHVSQAEAKIDQLSFNGCKSASDYKKYMKNFPRGKYYSQAKSITEDEDLWNMCVSTNTRDLYKKYLAQFPNGRHKEEAEKKASACYIATMVYGDYDHPQVVALRTFRDNTLRSSVLGRAFIRFYYQNSPAWVEKMQDKKTVNRIIRTLLDKFIKLYNHESK